MASIQLSSVLSPASVLESADPESQGIDPAGLERLYERIALHIEAGWYPGAAIAMENNQIDQGRNS